MRQPLTLLRDPVCRRIWLAGVAINVVRWLEFLAFALFALEMTGSPFLVALTGFARLIPLLFGAVLSAWIEGMDRRRVMLAVMMLLTAVDLFLLALTLLNMLTVGWLLAASFLAGIAWSFENSLRRTMLAEAAGTDRLGEIMALEAASNQATRMLGPAIGGVFVATIGLGGVFTFAVIMHGLGWWAMSGLPQKLAGSQRQAISLFAMLHDGIRYVRRHRLVQGSLAVTFIVNMWGFPYVSLAPVIGERVFDLTPVGTGLLLATEAAGGLIGSILIMMLATPTQFARIYSLGALIFIAALSTLGFWGMAPPAFLLLFVAGFGMAGFNSMQVTIPLLATPNDLKVRVMGLLTVCIGSSPLGFLHAGWLAEWLGSQNAQLIIGFEGVLALLFAFWRWPELLYRQPPTPV